LLAIDPVITAVALPKVNVTAAPDAVTVYP
jgi:hypothetical protein